MLVVTTDQTAEHRLAEAAARAWARQGGPPLALLITRTDLIAGQPDGVLGAIWRVPDSDDGSRRITWPLELPLPGVGSVASFTSATKRAMSQVSGGGDR